MFAKTMRVMDLYELDDDQETIFREIAERTRVNYHQLVNALRTHNGYETTKYDDLRQVICDSVSRLKKLRWIEEITSVTEELSVFHLTADGSIARRRF